LWRSMESRGGIGFSISDCGFAIGKKADRGMKNVEGRKGGTERRRPENLELRESGTEDGADGDGERCGGLCDSVYYGTNAVCQACGIEALDATGRAAAAAAVGDAADRMALWECADGRSAKET